MTDLLSFRMAACPAFDEWGSRLHMPLVFPCYFLLALVQDPADVTDWHRLSQHKPSPLTQRK
uniref:Pco105718 n=1 Tax=Arundo donax TaxID=35708 RepID=A0A0A9F4G0_ARUDO